MLPNRVTAGGYAGAMPLSFGPAGRTCDSVVVMITAEAIEPAAAVGLPYGRGLETTGPDGALRMVGPLGAVGT